MSQGPFQDAHASQHSLVFSEDNFLPYLHMNIHIFTKLVETALGLLQTLWSPFVALRTVLVWLTLAAILANLRPSTLVWSRRETLDCSISATLSQRWCQSLIKGQIYRGWCIKVEVWPYLLVNCQSARKLIHFYMTYVYITVKCVN